VSGPMGNFVRTSSTSKFCHFDISCDVGDVLRKYVEFEPVALYGSLLATEWKQTFCPISGAWVEADIDFCGGGSDKFES
jgi:hypothetical protein